jgi:hypothetical protein
MWKILRKRYSPFLGHCKKLPVDEMNIYGNGECVSSKRSDLLPRLRVSGP